MYLNAIIHYKRKNNETFIILSDTCSHSGEGIFCLRRWDEGQKWVTLVKIISVSSALFLICLLWCETVLCICILMRSMMCIFLNFRKQMPMVKFCSLIYHILVLFCGGLLKGKLKIMVNVAYASFLMLLISERLYVFLLYLHTPSGRSFFSIIFLCAWSLGLQLSWIKS